MSEISQTELVSDEELDQMIWKLERDGMTPKMLSLMRELREVRRAKTMKPNHPRITSDELDDETLEQLIEFRRETFDYHSEQGNKVQAIIHGVNLTAVEELKKRRAAMLQAHGTLTNEGTMQLSGNSEQLEPVSNCDELNSPATPDGWIPVSERMPASGGSEQRYVLAADFGNHYSPNIPNTQVGVYGDWFNDGNPTWDDGDGEDLHLKEVTHWMPLPAAPKEVG